MLTISAQKNLVQVKYYITDTLHNLEQWHYLNLAQIYLHKPTFLRSL